MSTPQQQEPQGLPDYYAGPETVPARRRGGQLGLLSFVFGAIALAFAVVGVAGLTWFPVVIALVTGIITLLIRQVLRSQRVMGILGLALAVVSALLITLLPLVNPGATTAPGVQLSVTSGSGGGQATISLRHSDGLNDQTDVTDLPWHITIHEGAPSNTAPESPFTLTARLKGPGSITCTVAYRGHVVSQNTVSGLNPSAICRYRA